MDQSSDTPYSLKNFLPLITIFALIIMTTLIKAHVTHTFDLRSLMNDFMGFFFVIFGLFKIINLSKFVEAYSMYDLIAQKSTLYAYLYPFIELALGILYLLRWYPIITHVVTLIVMLVSALGVALQLRKHEQIMCACLGALFKIPMTYVTLFEDLLMALMALLMLVV